MKSWSGAEPCLGQGSFALGFRPTSFPPVDMNRGRCLRDRWLERLYACVVVFGLRTHRASLPPSALDAAALHLQRECVSAYNAAPLTAVTRRVCALQHSVAEREG